MTMKKLVVRIALCAAAALCTSRSMSADLPWKYDTKDRPSDVSVTAQFVQLTTMFVSKSCSLRSVTVASPDAVTPSSDQKASCALAQYAVEPYFV